MKSSSVELCYPIRNQPQGIKPVKNIDGIKYFTEQQIKILRHTVKAQANKDKTQNRITGIREWMVIDILTSTGIRVGEAANIRCGDIKTNDYEYEIFIRCGKGSRSRHVQIPFSLKQHLLKYLAWKREQEELSHYDDHLFYGQRGPWTTQAIQQIVKKYLKILNFYEKGKSVHSLRHSYAVQLYRIERDILCVKKQLGHTSVNSTQIYTQATKDDIQKQIEKFWD